MDLQAELSENQRKVDFDNFDMSIRELVSLVEEETLDIAPVYQRQFRWPEEHQSEFIESVFLGLPIPPIFAAANSNGTWDLIDGVQRLSTLIHFLGNQEQLSKISREEPLRLSKLTKLKGFNGKTFRDLPEAVKLKFKMGSLRIVTITDKSDMEVRFDLFERLNKGGVILEPQEIRNCIFRGQFASWLAELSEDANFRNVVRIPSKKANNGTPEEMVLRFFAFYHSYDKFNHYVIEFLNKFMEESTKSFKYRKNRRIFDRTFEELDRVYPEGIVRGRSSQTPVNLFEGIAVGAALALDEREYIDRNVAQDLLESSQLQKYSGAGSNTRKMVRQRIEYCYEAFRDES